MSLNSKIFADNISAPKVGRSKFKIPFEHKTTFKAGDLVPIYSCDILPGDSVDMNLSLLHLSLFLHKEHTLSI